MPSTRNKYTNKHPLVLVSSTSQFDQIIPTDLVYPHLTILPLSTQKQINRLSLLYPQILVVNPIMNPKPLLTLPPNYIRQPFNFTFPPSIQYELTQLDSTFLKHCKCRYGYSALLDEEFLREAIVCLQCSCKRIGSEGDFSDWLHKIKKDKGFWIDNSKSKEIQQAIFRYWCYRRRQYKFPVYRLSWRTTENIDYLHQIYRSRQTRKLGFVRDKKRIDRYCLEELAAQFKAVESICCKIQAREQLKYQQTQAELKEFLSTVNHLVGTDLLQYFTPFVLFDRNEDKAKAGSALLFDEDQSTQTLPLEESNILVTLGSDIRNQPSDPQQFKASSMSNPTIVHLMDIKLSPFKQKNPEENNCKVRPAQTHSKNEFDSTHASNIHNLKKQPITATCIKPLDCLVDVNSKGDLATSWRNQLSAEELLDEGRV